MKNEIGLIPSLLDRLTDDKPRSRFEYGYSRSLSIPQFRESILKDILFLLNTICFDCTEIEFELPENVRRSTLNYGIPAFLGVNISDIDWVDVEAYILEALTNFEPRLDAKDLKVNISYENEAYSSHNQLMIEIKGKIKVNPYSREFWLRTAVDVETGLFSLIDGSINE